MKNEIAPSTQMHILITSAETMPMYAAGPQHPVLVIVCVAVSTAVLFLAADWVVATGACGLLYMCCSLRLSRFSTSVICEILRYGVTRKRTRSCH